MAVLFRKFRFARLIIALAMWLALRGSAAAIIHGNVGPEGICPDFPQNLCPKLPPCQLPACNLPKCNIPKPSCLPEIDQTGEHLFKPHPPHYHKVPHPWHEHHSASGVIIWPRRVVAPVNTEVVMLGGVCEKDGHLRAGEDLEWIIAPGGVGHFLTVGHRTWMHSLSLLGDAPKKIDNTYAVSTTLGRYVCLTRGTTSTDDDIPVQKGQTWVTLSSPVEGTTYVTAFGPDIYGWDRRQQTAEIYWVDAQWNFPPPAANPIGTRHAFTTVVSKYSNRAPVIGWRVRYEITGGPAAGFSPDGAQVVEVPTNELGQATAEIFQTTPSAGTNTIGIQIIRPADSATGNQRMVMGTGSTSKTWSSPDISLQKTGPAQAAVGATVNYRIDIVNPGGATARDVVVTDQLAPGMTHVSSNPPGTLMGQQLQWRLGDLSGGQRVSIEFTVRADQPGTFNSCASLTTGEGLNAQDCVSTTVTATSAVDVRISAPEQATVGQDVTFQVSVTNRGNTQATGLRVKSTFDAGLQHSVGGTSLEKDLNPLGPGETQQVAITLRATQAGRLCNNVEVLSGNSVMASQQACVNAAAPLPGQTPTIQLQKTGPSSLMVGEVAEFNIVVTNNGQVAVNDLKVADNYDVALDPVRATDGYTFVGDDMVWRIDTLPPGRQVRLQIHCRCQQPIARACNRVTVTTREGARGDAEACLEIRPANSTTPSTTPGTNPTPPVGAPGRLNVTVSDRHDPATAGRELIYEIRITNPTGAPMRQIQVRADASPDIQPIATGTSGPSRAGFPSPQRVEFVAHPELAAGGQLVYFVGVRALRPGTGRLSVQVSSAGAAPESAEASTTIIPQQ